ncbi:hypothetical protein L2E82_14084 [Cichorium intybus]|uniref:Uncharacterized protein n=1 Tax=Cichorium intybus TaxID=13427 RepID=A0ACB9EYQ0_CICIN|nr:hypothetical protein L2E82_14084 [Cichorium intybus]
MVPLLRGLLLMKEKKPSKLRQKKLSVCKKEKKLKSCDKENMKLKEIYRTKVQHDLKNLEMMCHDMASLLLGLGILIDNGSYASSHQESFMLFGFSCLLM